MKKFFSILLSLITIIGVSVGIFNVCENKGLFDKDKSKDVTPDNSIEEEIDYEQAYNELVQNANGATVSFIDNCYGIEFIKSDRVGGGVMDSLNISTTPTKTIFNSYLHYNVTDFDKICSLVDCDSSEYIWYVGSIGNDKYFEITYNETFTQTAIRVYDYRYTDYEISYNPELILLDGVTRENYTGGMEYQCFIIPHFTIVENMINFDIKFIFGTSFDSINNYLISINY